MTFVAYVNQTDNGCDYTIACGKILWRLKAETHEEALAELKDRVLGTFCLDSREWEDGWWGETRISSIILLEVCAEEDVPLPEWYAWAEQMTKSASQLHDETEERRQYEMLKKKYS